MDGLCDLTLARLGDLRREPRVEVHSYFNVLTRVCISVDFAPEGMIRSL